MNHPSPALTEEESNWVSEFAGRLRLIQADCSSAPPEKRREYLQEEIVREIKGVPEANRKRYLAALLERFPVAGKVLESKPVPQPVPVAEAAPETPEQILRRFLEVIERLPEEKRRQLASPVIDAGLVPAAQPQPTEAPVLELSQELQRALGLPAECQPRLDRLAQLTAQLMEAFSTLDQTALRTLNQLNSRSALLRRPEDIRRSAARFLAGETDSLEPQLRTVTSLLGALLAAMLAGGREFGRDYLSRFSAGAIEDVVAGEGGKLFGLGPNKKERCWDKYTDLANDFATPDLIDRRIKDCLAAFIEKTARSGR